MWDVFSSLVQAVLWITAMHPREITDSPALLSRGTIPGGSALKFCNESRGTDLYAIDRIELYPKPLYIDDIFEVHLYGTFLQNITNNATWTYWAQYGNSTEQETGTMDFCQSMDSIDQPDRHGKRDCPPAKGFGLIMMSAWVMPMFIVPGDYHFKFDARTKEGERIYCLDADISLDYKDKPNQRDSSSQININVQKGVGSGQARLDWGNEAFN